MTPTGTSAGDFDSFVAGEDPKGVTPVREWRHGGAEIGSSGGERPQVRPWDGYETLTCESGEKEPNVHTFHKFIQNGSRKTGRRTASSPREGPLPRRADAINLDDGSTAAAAGPPPARA